MVRSGNPKGLRCGADLAQSGVRLVNREVGAGSRLLLDTTLASEDVPADVGVSTAALAAIYGLDFVPLRLVRYDLAVLEDSLTEEPVKQLLSTLEHRWVKSQLETLGGYDTSHTGEVTMA